MEKRFIWLAAVMAVIVLLLFGAYKVMNSRTFQVFGGLTSEVKTDEKVVA